MVPASFGAMRAAYCILRSLLLCEGRRGDERVYTQAFAGCFNGNDQFSQKFLRSISGRMP